MALTKNSNFIWPSNTKSNPYKHANTVYKLQRSQKNFLLWVYFYGNSYDKKFEECNDLINFDTLDNPVKLLQLVDEGMYSDNYKSILNSIRHVYSDVYKQDWINGSIEPNNFIYYDFTTFFVEELKDRTIKVFNCEREIYDTIYKYPSDTQSPIIKRIGLYDVNKYMYRLALKNEYSNATKVKSSDGNDEVIIDNNSIGSCYYHPVKGIYYYNHTPIFENGQWNSIIK